MTTISPLSMGNLSWAPTTLPISSPLQTVPPTNLLSAGLANFQTSPQSSVLTEFYSIISMLTMYLASILQNSNASTLNPTFMDPGITSSDGISDPSIEDTHSYLLTTPSMDAETETSPSSDSDPPPPANETSSAIQVESGFTVTPAQLQTVQDAYNRIPAGIRKATEAKGAGINLVTGGVGNDPSMASMRDQTTWDGTRTYADLPGVGAGAGGKTIISADLVGAGRDGSADLVLHEHGHTTDATLGNLHEQADWMNVYNQNKGDTTFLDDYSRAKPDEAFAESFARYYHSPETRAQLPQDVQAYFANLKTQYPN
jgi:hypothetical protein